MMHLASYILVQQYYQLYNVNIYESSNNYCSMYVQLTAVFTGALCLYLQLYLVRFTHRRAVELQ